MRNSIKAVAFDIDGTLYPDLGLYLRIIPYFLKNLSFFIHFNEVRKILHRTAPLGDFYEYQARLLAEKMKISSQDAKKMINDVVYEGLKPYFKKVKTFKYVEETFKAFKESGLKIGILSDFPPSQKGSIWNLDIYCDVILGSEECGSLKPSLYPFGLLSRALDVPYEEILYVGNSIRSDIIGAKNAGMKTAYIMPLWRRVLHKPLSIADISFGSYRKLKETVLQ